MPRELLKKIALRALVGVPLFAVTFYITMFVMEFEMLAAPVRTEVDWLGPPLRNTALSSMGDFYVAEEPVDSRYRLYAPLCGIWLVANGYF